MKIRISTSLLLIATVSILTLAGVTGLHAQATDSILVGNVTDPSDALVPNATVTATNLATGVKYSGATNAAGTYRINNVPVGTYDVEASATGLAGNKVSGVVLELNRTASVNFKLKVGTVSTVVEVVESNPLIDTSSAQLQNTFNSELSVNLPSAGNFKNDSGVLNLSLLAPGVTQSGGMGYGTGPSVGGQRPTNNSFNIDGVDNNRHDVTGPLSLVPNDAIAQFSILENQFSPEFGGASGGIFNTVVKTGTNELHGSVYEYLNNRNLNAVDSLKSVQGFKSNPRFDYNRFGGTVGGPILKNKLFYFADWEYSPLGEASTPGSPIQAPTAAGYQTIQSLPGISKTNLDVLQQYLAPAPTASGTIKVGGVTIPIGQVQVVGPSYVNKQNVVASVDWNIGDKDQVRGRYLVNRYSGINTNAQLPIFYTQIPDNRSLTSLSEFHTFNATMINEFRAAYSRKNNNYPVGDFKFPGLDQFPNLTFDDLNLQVGPDSSTPQGYVQGALQLSDNLTKTWGRHTFKGGYQFQDVIASNNFVQRSRGDYDYTTLDLYLRDLSPDSIGERSVGVAGGIPAGYLFHTVYFNDDYRIRPNLTVNLGIRYEYMTVPVVTRYQSFSSVADLPGLITFGEPKPQKSNWAPRVGIAWSPGNSAVWSVRAGFGINYDQPYNNLNINAKPGYFQQTEDVPSLTNNTPNFLANGGLPPSNAIVLTTDPATARAAVSAYNYDQIRPYSINYTVGIQRSLGKDYTLEARYVGTKGVHLYVQDQINRVTVVTPSYSLPTFVTAPSADQLAGLNLTLGQIKNTLLALTNYAASPSNFYGQFGFTNTITAYHPVGNSKYNGLSLQLNKRYAKNYSFMTAFTWSHALDDSTATVFSTNLTPRRGQDFRNLRNDWASSALDRRLRFTFTPTYDLKMFEKRNWMMKNIVGNWNFSATYTYQSPAYATVQSGIDSNLNNDSAPDRAVVNPAGDGTLSTVVTAIDKTGATVAAGSASIVGYVAKNPNARYIQAGQGVFANAGRNTFPLHPIDNIDFQILKRIAVTERMRLELGGQFSNLLNHPQWTGDLLNDVYPNQLNNTRSFLLTGNAAFGRFDQFYTSNSRTLTVIGRFVF
jgi:Carboxypeptidase regulatory-like domain